MKKPSEIKKQVIALLKASDIPLNEVAEISGVPYITLYSWFYKDDSLDPRLSTIEAVLEAIGFKLELIDLGLNITSFEKARELEEKTRENPELYPQYKKAEKKAETKPRRKKKNENSEEIIGYGDIFYDD